jgi:hypothetical protein
MIVDVVASRQRNYRSRVKAIVANWEATNQQHSIQWLAEHPLDATRFGLSEAEVVTIFEVARKLRAFTLNEGLLGPDGRIQLVACGPEDAANLNTLRDLIRWSVASRASV